jgi:tetrapyrrole methylase family protein/MazG family protein
LVLKVGDSMSGITILGLGPGNPFQLTREAWEILLNAREIHLRTRQHPTVAGLPAHLQVNSFDFLYETSESFEDVYARIIEQVLDLGRREQGVIYAVPGDPFVAEATSPEIARQALEQGMNIRVVNGLSFLEPVFTLLGIDPLPHLLILDAIELSQKHIAAFPSDMPVLVAQIYSKLIAAEVKTTLNTVYPDEHPVFLVHTAGMPDQVVEKIPLYEIDRSDKTGLTTVLYLPPLAEGISFEAFQEVVAHLRAPDGCPWDREQTTQSMRPHLLEEAYEVLAAVDSGDSQKIVEEFGDLLLQIVMNVQIASEAGDYSMTDVIKGIKEKIIRRHPHVFGDLEVKDVKGVLQNWENIKAEEREEIGKNEGLLDGVPLTLPALSQAQEYQDRVARVGFDWNSLDGVLEKIGEEIRELREAKTEDQVTSELGDLFFSLVNLARWKTIDSETALREANLRFRRRWSLMEKSAQAAGKDLSGMSLDDLEDLWQRAKKKGI